jgi:hypothetical protein
MNKVGEEIGEEGEINQALYAHMNNKRKVKKKKKEIGEEYSRASTQPEKGSGR